MDDLTARGIRAAVAVARSHDVRVDTPVVLRDASNLLVHLRPAPVVARVATSTALGRPDVLGHFRRAESVTRWLAARGVPVVPASPLFPPGPFVHDDLVVSFAQHVPHDPTWVPTSFAARLAELHTELLDYPDPLPTRLPLSDVDHAITTWTRSPDELAAFTAERDTLAATWPTTGSRPLHGDAHPGNLLLTPHGPLWNDFEDTWHGPVAWDLACLALTSRLDGMAAARAYPQVVDLAFHLRLRRLHVTGWLMVLERRFPRYREAADEGFRGIGAG
ncbi:phosphotransferase [Umezawaea tangerina]|uniref:Phosphotransferase family enzyme n=1 Tax=Umezawaea tangerina TaxID=84725 RepID=A0A2T0SPC0_9PSEU|nr:phosphotransferase [Umezawaea tangerina]PRY35213.1 phosphotransferase family enzyme [Umezawaea tangerina]